MPQVLYEMLGPFSRTVMSSRGSIRLAREAAVSPAALPPMMRIFKSVASIHAKREGTTRRTGCARILVCLAAFVPLWFLPAASQVLLPCLDPGVWIAFPRPIDDEVRFVFSYTDALQSGIPEDMVYLFPGEAGAECRLDVGAHAAAVS